MHVVHLAKVEQVPEHRPNVCCPVRIARVIDSHAVGVSNDRRALESVPSVSVSPRTAFADVVRDVELPQLGVRAVSHVLPAAFLEAQELMHAHHVEQLRGLLLEIPLKPLLMVSHDICAMGADAFQVIKQIAGGHDLGLQVARPGRVLRMRADGVHVHEVAEYVNVGRLPPFGKLH